jgi:multiple sugar transport system ATP-binding protein
MVFQNYALYPHMSVRDNMSYGLKLTTDLSEEEIAARVEETAALLDIPELLDKQPSNISGGQQQRVATGRAIVRDPEVFLMDEPLSNLDAKLKLHMRTELQRLHDELESTTIYVTHDQEEAMTMSDRIVILADGEIQQIATSDEIYAEPANLFVADFIGSPSMNFFDVRLDGDSLVAANFTCDLSSELAAEIRTSDATELVVGIRPEDIGVADVPTDNAITTRVDVVEPAGSDNYVYTKNSESEFTVRTPTKVRPTEGDEIEIAFGESELHVFDSESGLRVS